MLLRYILSRDEDLLDIVSARLISISKFHPRLHSHLHSHPCLGHCPIGHRRNPRRESCRLHHLLRLLNLRRLRFHRQERPRASFVLLLVRIVFVELSSA